MSTLTGQSLLQPLHARHRSSASFTCSSLPAAGERIALEHLEQQARAAARRVLLLARDPVARAHRAAIVRGGTRRRRRSGASPRRSCRRSFGKRESASATCGRVVAGAEAQVLVDAVRVDDLARVHLPVRIPDRLELAERLDQLRAEHLRQELASRLAVAVLARERAAVATRRASAASSMNARYFSMPSAVSDRSRSACGCSPGRSGRRARRA